MITFNIDQFLTAGSGNLPAPISADRPWIAVGIHPSSEVDTCVVGSLLVTARTIVPINGEGSVRALRVPRHGANLLSAQTYLANPIDQVTAPGDKLVLILWEACDDVETPGPRVPVLRQAIVKPAPTTQATAALAFRLPFSGRVQCALTVLPTVADVLVGVTGIRYPLFGANGNNAQFIESPIQTATFGVPGTFGPGAGTIVQSKGIYLTEDFDELAVFVWSPGGGSCQINAEVSGEQTV